MNNELLEKVLELQTGAYDLHVHSLPSVFPRIQDGMEVIKDADQRSMAGILLKSHYEPTALRASFINKYSNCHTKAFGGLVLNYPVGGLNPYAVINAVKAGAKIIWMPTRDSQNSLNFGNMEGDFFNRKGITILDDSGNLKPVIYEIMDIIKDSGRFLATGHLNPTESIKLCKIARQRNVPIILTHPEFFRTKIPGDIQKDLADLGVIIEKNWFNIVQKSVTKEEMALNIRIVGPERVYIASDRGQLNGKKPVEEYGNFIAMLIEMNFTDAEIKMMTHVVPEMIITH